VGLGGVILTRGKWKCKSSINSKKLILGSASLIAVLMMISMPFASADSSWSGISGRTETPYSPCPSTDWYVYPTANPTGQIVKMHWWMKSGYTGNREINAYGGFQKSWVAGTSRTDTITCSWTVKYWVSLFGNMGSDYESAYVKLYLSVKDQTTGSWVFQNQEPNQNGLSQPFSATHWGSSSQIYTQNWNSGCLNCFYRQFSVVAGHTYLWQTKVVCDLYASPNMFSLGCGGIMRLDQTSPDYYVASCNWVIVS
jgi:hypothetical protein